MPSSDSEAEELEMADTNEKVLDKHFKGFETSVSSLPQKPTLSNSTTSLMTVRILFRCRTLWKSVREVKQ